MKTVFLTILCITFFLSFPLNVNAEKSNNPINSGHTATGSYYEVFEVSTDFSTIKTRNIGDSIAVTREFLYYEILIPPTHMNYCETINDITYKGILNLSGFQHEAGKTHAVYTGTLTVVREN